MAEKTSEIDLVKAFRASISFTYQRRKLLILSFLLGAIAGLIYSVLTRKVYESRMLINSTLLTVSFTEEIVSNTFNIMLANKQCLLLSRALSISEEQCRELISFDVRELIEDITKPLAEGDKHDLIIKVRTYDPAIFPLVEKGIINYLEQNEFVKIRTEQRKEYYRELVQKVEEEIRDLEDFKRRLQRGDFLENMKGNLMFDPTSVDTKILELTKENIRNRQSLELAGNIHVINSFSAVGQPALSRKSVWMIIGSLVGLLIGFSISFFGWIRREAGKNEQTAP